jgi:hypothetical protein
VAIDQRAFRFRRRALDELTALMAELADRADGKSWVNIQPAVDDDIPVESGLARAFSGRGPLVPNATWVPGHATRRKPVPTTVGLEHHAGKDALGQLDEKGVRMPEGWVPEQDHPKRGLIFAVPDGEPPTIALEFLLTASGALCPVPIGDEWVAVVSTQR